VAKNPDADLSSAYKYMAYVYHDKEEFDKSLDYFAKVNPDIVDFEDHIMQERRIIQTRIKTLMKQSHMIQLMTIHIIIWGLFSLEKKVMMQPL